MADWENARADMLKSIKSPCNHLHEIKSDEFTMLGAPGQPDYATVSIDLDIKEGAKAPELKSVKEYLHQFRYMCMSYERAALLIKDHFMEVYDPSNVDVTLEFKPRGGLSSKVQTWDWNERTGKLIDEVIKDG